MSDEPETDRAEARRVRRRWLTIGEAVAVAGVVIAGLTFWNGRAERQEAAAERAADRDGQTRRADAARHRVSLSTASADDRGIAVRAGAGCTLQSLDIRFPAALGVQPLTTVVDHRIEADHVSRALLALTDDGPARREGRVPVLIDAVCETPDGTREETATYDLLWRTEPGGLLSGRTMRLRGLTRRAAGGDQARLDALWQGA